MHFKISLYVSYTNAPEDGH